MKPVEIRDLDTEELHVRVAEFKDELFNLRFQLATGQLDNHARITDVKRDVARIKTILRERDYEAMAAASSAPSAPTEPSPPESAPAESAPAESAPDESAPAAEASDGGASA